MNVWNNNNFIIIWLKDKTLPDFIKNFNEFNFKKYNSERLNLVGILLIQNGQLPNKRWHEYN